MLHIRQIEQLFNEGAPGLSAALVDLLNCCERQFEGLRFLSGSIVVCPFNRLEEPHLSVTNSLALPVDGGIASAAQIGQYLRKLPLSSGPTRMNPI
jgi:hypothetical protein